MSSNRVRRPIRVGLIADDPIRMEGLHSVFENPPQPGQTRLLTVDGTLEALLTNTEIDYLVVDLNSAAGRLSTLKEIRRSRPSLRLIVIGPEDDDDLVMGAILAGARAYLGFKAGPQVVREAMEIVVSGSIWAPRRLLSRVIDRLLAVPDNGSAGSRSALTARERQVLDLILLARSTREIALELGIEERTVKAHVAQLMRKTGAENRVELSIRALNGSIANGSDSARLVKGKIQRKLLPEALN